MVLPKHLRPRVRYLAVTIEAPPATAFQRADLAVAIEDSAAALLGDAGMAAIDPRIVRYDFEAGSGEFLLRTRRDRVESARAAIACVTAVSGDSCRLQVIGTSGTIRTCEEKYLGERPILGEERTVAFDGAQRRAHVRDGRIDVRVAEGFVGATDLDLE